MPVHLEVYPTSPKFPCAGSGKKKTNAAFFNQSVNFIEENRQTLDFIYDNDLVLRIEFLGDAAGILAQSQIYGGVEEIMRPHSFQGMADERGFSRLPWTEKEMRKILQKKRRKIQPPLDVHRTI